MAGEPLPEVFEEPIAPALVRPGGQYRNPGRDEAIAAMVLAFLFPILGFIIAVFSINRSKRVGWPAEKMARFALWLSVLVFILGVLSYLFMGARFGYGIPILRNLWWI
jgi:hypothetical protein